MSKEVLNLSKREFVDLWNEHFPVKMNYVNKCNCVYRSNKRRLEQKLHIKINIINKK